MRILPFPLTATRRATAGLLGLALALAPTSAPAQDAPPDARDEVAERRPERIAEAMEPLAMLEGVYDTHSRVTGRDGRMVEADLGVTVCQFRAQRWAFSIEKATLAPDGRRYDDILMFQYDSAAKAVRATMFMPLFPAPRPIEVSIDAAERVVTLDYAPAGPGGSGLVTRETITVGGDGDLFWRIEHRQPDGSYRTTREIFGTRRPAPTTAPTTRPAD